jgi:hypothetical protein
MPSFTAPRCRHIKINGTQCGSPALRNNDFCFYHQDERPVRVDCFFEEKYPIGDITMPYFEDAHAIQYMLRRTVQMVLQRRIEQKTASLVFYALQIASSNLKRMELEKPQPEQVVVDVVPESKGANTFIAFPAKQESEKEEFKEEFREEKETAVETSVYAQPAIEPNQADLPPGTIQACQELEHLHRARADARRRRFSHSPHAVCLSDRSFGPQSQPSPFVTEVSNPALAVMSRL